MPLIIDAHCDLAWNMLSFGRDYTRSAAETRALEKGTATVEANEDTVIGWPEYQRGRIAIVFSTLFAAPKRRSAGMWDRLCYEDSAQAHQLYRQQLLTYHELAEEKPSHFAMIRNRRQLDEHLDLWAGAKDESKPVGLIALMEGADGIRSVDELGDWYELGLRLIGLAWTGTRYSGGTREPGPLTPEGRKLLRAMSDFGFVLDLSHMDEKAALEALDLYEGTVVATHVNCLDLLPDYPTNRHYSDAVLRRIIERGGIIGNIPACHFLQSGWSNSKGSRREEAPLDAYVAHLDHVCQLAGDSLHSGIGADFDGGFGLQSMPAEIDTAADLQKVVPLLEKRGYSNADAENILGLNWIRMLRSSLPA